MQDWIINYYQFAIIGIILLVIALIIFISNKNSNDFPPNTIDDDNIDDVNIDNRTTKSELGVSSELTTAEKAPAKKKVVRRRKKTSGTTIKKTTTKK